jgi:hypothetical protein
MAEKPKKLLDQVRDAKRLKHYAYRTEQSCSHIVYKAQAPPHISNLQII